MTVSKPTKCFTVHVVQLFSVVFSRLRILQAAGLYSCHTATPQLYASKKQTWLLTPLTQVWLHKVASKHQPSASYQTDITEEALRYLWGREIFKCLNFLFMLSTNIAASIVYRMLVPREPFAGQALVETRWVSNY